MQRVRQNESKKAFCKSPPNQEYIITRGKEVWLLSRVIVDSLVRRFMQTGISIQDAQYRRDLRKQRQNETVNLQSRIDVSGSSR